jgi:aerobic-type carbon monoxide dehydrogenase small subunit (CoxS/CutS family)
MRYVIRVNGTEREIEAEPGHSLLSILRNDLALTGSKYGCGEGQCGACTVLLDGRRVYSCRTPMQNVGGKQVRTIEGLADGDKLHPVQEAFLAESGFQCAYCTSGMIMSTVALLEQNAKPTDEEIRNWMNRHVCRCCSYANITKAVARAAGQ